MTYQKLYCKSKMYDIPVVRIGLDWIPNDGEEQTPPPEALSSYTGPESAASSRGVPPSLPTLARIDHAGSPRHWRAPRVNRPGPLFDKVLAFDRIARVGLMESQGTSSPLVRS